MVAMSKKRTGLTLMEVLITIFVMGIGFLSVLTLFPLAAKKIGRGIDSDRVTLIAGNSVAMAKILGIREAVDVVFDAELDSISTDNRLPDDVKSKLRLNPSSIVHFDPLGVYGLGVASVRQPGIFPPFSWSPYAGGMPGNYLLGFPTAIPFNIGRELLVSQDEMQFNANGTPETDFRRGNRYSISYLYRRSALSDPLSINCLVLAYVGRPVEFQNATHVPLTLDPNSSAKGSQELVVENSYVPMGPDRVLGKNSWIMDASYDLGLGNIPRPRWNKFYQIHQAEPDPARPTTHTRLTLNRQLDDDVTRAVWIDYLFEVFDRGTGE